MEDSLHDLIRQHFPQVLLCAPAVLRRLIQRDRQLRGWRHVPHQYGVALSLSRLSGLDPALLAQTDRAPSDPGTALFLLPAPPEDTDLEGALREVAPSLFRLQVEFGYARALAAGTLSPQLIREHTHRLGLIETDEIRQVLRSERELLPARSGEDPICELWATFAGKFMLLMLTDADQLSTLFPSLWAQRQRIEQIIRRDLPIEVIWAPLAPYLPPAAQDVEVVRQEGPAAPRPTAAARVGLLRRAESAHSRGNHARALALCVRAAAGDDGDKIRRQRDQALLALARRLSALSGPGVEAWRRGIASLIERLGAPSWSPTMRLLLDLQNACVDHERPAHRVDLVEWALSRGRRPVRRPLPIWRRVSVLRHLRRARQRLLAVGASDEGQLARCLSEISSQLEASLRVTLRGVLLPPLQRELPLNSRVTQVAAEKIVAELSDRIIEKGRIDFAVLRDGISRNQAKMRDLAGAGRFLRGDALLAIDRAIAAPLEGLYRRGELYRRWLQRLSSLAFGTAIGRGLTKLLVLPLAGAYLILEGLQHTLVLLAAKLSGQTLSVVSWPAVLAVAALLGLLINSAAVRRWSWSLLSAFGRGLRWLFFTIPVHVASWPPVRWLGRVLANAVVLVLGRERVDRLTDAGLRLGRYLGRQLIPGLVRGILALFRGIVDRFERVLYAVDEWLRFREGERRARVALKAAIGLPWSLISYVVRLYINVLIEPKYNPVKHFPVVTVGHKIVLPMSVMLTRQLARPLAFLGPTAATAIAGITVFLIPGFFGFLAWELKENWRLYESNRAPDLQPVVISAAGETISRLLRPGFHSGTVPRLFAKLRKATRRRAVDRAIAVATLQEKIAHVGTEVRRFLERDLLSLLRAKGASYRVGDVEIASNRLRVRLDADAAQALGLWLIIALQGQVLVGDLLPDVEELPLAADSVAWAGLWRLCGVEVDLATLRRELGPKALFDVDGATVRGWPDPSASAEHAVWRLDATAATVDGDGLPETARVKGTPLSWWRWQAHWEG